MSTLTSRKLIDLAFFSVLTIIKLRILAHLIETIAIKSVSLISLTHLEQFVFRTFLMWKILILLNRLVSSPSYSATVLLDVAVRLSQKGNENKQQDSMTKQIRRTEIVNLACIFKKRVCA
ncbi:dimerizations protein, putative [Medicago truncatula]|uniref:Dimerizations protein, putative n=1 Tax=Medicago truncatula TaxID=3880 RepID=G7KC70_MEDTR|nr:dimerizations protein, putative [Medicago truncatula]